MSLPLTIKLLKIITERIKIPQESHAGRRARGEPGGGWARVEPGGKEA